MTSNRAGAARRRGRVAAALVVLLSALGLAAVVPSASAEGPELPGMCNGRSDAYVVVNAHARGPVKYVLNIATDAVGAPDGVLIVGKGPSRLYIDQFCRLWQHLPGQEPGGDMGCSADQTEGATIVHAVGVGTLADGTRVLVRTDARGTDEGQFFRVRYKAMGGHDDHLVVAAEEGEEGGCSDDSWTRVPAEGWAPLDLLNVRVVSE